MSRAIKLVVSFHEHDMRTDLVLLEDLQPRARDLLGYPGLRGPRHETGLAANNWRWNFDARNHIAPALRRVVIEKIGGVTPRQFEVLLGSISSHRQASPW